MARVSRNVCGLLACMLSLVVSIVSETPAPIYPIDERVDAILASFNVDDLVGQMTQINIGSFWSNDTIDEEKLKSFATRRIGSFLDSPSSGGMVKGQYALSAKQWREVITKIQNTSMAANGGHPILYGVDSVHGAIYIQNATIFGQQINAGASFNPVLVREMGRITGRDTLAAGIPWVFGPILDISQNSLWARTYETFGEDPYLASVMGDAIIRGIQSDRRTAACMKHFIAYSKTTSGHDRVPVTVTDFELLNTFALPYRAAIQAGAKTVMESFVSINGVPTVANHKLLTQLLRYDMGFEGLLVTDWAEIYNLQHHHRIVRTQLDAVATSLTQTSLDMSMVPNETSFINHTLTLLERRPVYLDRVKQSVRRTIKTKLELGLYENPVPGEEFVDLVGSAPDRKVALDLARESIVLLQNNDSVLPLPKSSSIFLTGHSADNIGHLCGGWTLRWQGMSGNKMFPNGVSLRQGLEQLADKPSKVSYFNGLYENGTYSESDLEKAKSLAKDAQYTVVAIGEGTYAEKPGDIDDLTLPVGQLEYVHGLASTETKIILILVGGRPRLLRGLPIVAAGVINALLPCEAGGTALAEIIYGVTNPSGRMPITYPKSHANIMMTYNAPVSELCADGHLCETEWDFGHGLSYTTFKYSPVKLVKLSVNETDSLTASVTITNIGSRAGKETVMLFIIQPYRLISITERKQLKKFEKVELAPGQSIQVNFTLTYEDWSVYKPQIGHGFLRWAEPGEFVVAIKPETDCNVYYRGNLTNPLCASFTLEPDFEPKADIC